MKLKESRLCCAFAWNPRDAKGDQLMLAAGSIAGAMDDNFSSEAFLEIRKVDLSNTNSNDLPVIGRVVMPDRAHRVHWTSHGGTNGMIAAGLVDGTVKVWSADKMLETYDGSADAAPSAFNDDPFGANGPLPEANGAMGGETDPEAATLCVINAHQNGVRGLQFNPMRRDLLATGGGDRELCIWSLTNPTEPMKVPTPPKSTHAGEITDVRWNVKFEHIIGTTTSAGTFSLWDLRSLRQTQQISGQQGAATTLAWHPEGLTQVAIARDGVNPVVQIWDLKKANAPIKELRGHQNGIVGLGWCHDDSNLLFSAGCDGRTICWNPNSGELVGELAPQNNWVTDVAWCPRVPAIVATSSFDSTLAVHAAQDVSGTTATGTATLPKAVPKWLNRPCSATFGFGGRIVRLNKKAPAVDGQPANTTLEVITIQKEVDPTDSNFRAEFAASIANPEWVASKGHADIAAVATSNLQGSREAVLAFLGVPPAEVDDALKNVAEGFGADEKEVDDLIARCVACGKLTEAVDLCISSSRFDDAFAVAFLKGTEEVTRVHNAFIAHRSEKARFASYVGAIATKDLTKLKAGVEGKTIPWREALAVLASFMPPQQFTAAANGLGETLETMGDAESAASCYICAGSVDAVARLWSKSKSMAAFIHSTEIFEAVAKVECRDKVFIDALASYADQLAKAGDYKGALNYAARAARMGSLEGAVVADLCQTMVAPADRLNVRFPFSPIQIPETRSPLVQQIAGMQQPVARRVDPTPQQMNQQQQQQQMNPNNRPMGGMPQQHPMNGAAPPLNNNINNNVPQHPSLQMASNTNNMMMQHNNNGPNNNGGNMMRPPMPMNNNGNTMAPPMPNPNGGNFQPSQFNNGPMNNNGGNMMAPPMPNGNNGMPMRSSTPSMPMPMNNNGNMMAPPPPMGGAAPNRMMAMPPSVGGAGAMPPMNNGMPNNANPMMPMNNNMAPPPMPQPNMAGPPPPMGGAAPNMPPPPMGGNNAMNNNNMMMGSGPMSPAVPPPPPTTPAVPPPPGPQGGANFSAPPMQPPAPSNNFAAPPQHPVAPVAAAPPMPPMPMPQQAPANPMMAPPMNTNNAMPPMQQPPQPAPMAMSRPSLVASTYGGPASAAAPLAGSGSSCVVFTYNVSTIPSVDGQNVANAIIDATNKIKEKRKRDSIEKAALELFAKLSRSEVSEPCLQLLVAYVAALGTPAAKDAWRKVSDAHFSEIGPYLNLKFL